MKAKFLICMMLSTLICSCGEDDAVSVLPEEDNAEVFTKITLLDTNEDTYYFSREGGEITVTITADGPWTATSSHDWLKVQPSSGEAGTHLLTITIPTYEAEDSRFAEVQIGKDANKMRLKFSQAPVPEVRSLHDYELTASPVRLTLYVYPELDFEITLTEGAEQWITPLNTRSKWDYFHENTTGLNFEISPNDTDHPRTGTVTLSRDGRDYSFTVSQHHDDDLRPVLMEFYHALGGEQWKYNQNWGTDAPLNDWSGLRLEDGQIVALQMHYNNLKGEIPEVIGQLKTLQEFDILGDEDVVGKLPESLGELPNLRRIQISFNSISGAIPASLGNASKLETLWLCYNQLSGEIPGELGALPLEGLNLTGNNLTGNIPEGLTKMHTINRLFLTENRLSGTISSTVNAWLSGIKEAQINPQQEGYGLSRW
ncbi:MAG: hypothetical protein J6T82_09205 [Bacteroidaceae bacterium]|nr:hypothetical protein [Bacteroidaceae bacterium]